MVKVTQRRNKMRNPIAKDLRQPKYKMRVEKRKNTYNKKQKHKKPYDVS